MNATERIRDIIRRNEDALLTGIRVSPEVHEILWSERVIVQGVVASYPLSEFEGYPLVIDSFLPDGYGQDVIISTYAGDYVDRKLREVLRDIDNGFK